MRFSFLHPAPKKLQRRLGAAVVRKIVLLITWSVVTRGPRRRTFLHRRRKSVVAVAVSVVAVAVSYAVKGRQRTAVAIAVAVAIGITVAGRLLRLFLGAAHGFTHGIWVFRRSGLSGPMILQIRCYIRGRMVVCGVRAQGLNDNRSIRIAGGGRCPALRTTRFLVCGFDQTVRQRG